MPADDTLITFLVLLAAFTHACWHAMLKFQGDMLQTIASVYGVSALVCAGLAPLVAFPTPVAFVFILASVALHCGSYVYIARAYEASDLSHAFPLYRGLAPILVALGAWLFAGERPAALAMAGLLLAAGGVASLAFGSGQRWHGSRLLLVQLLLSALFVAAYTVVDGMGVRRAGSTEGYVVWLFLLNGPVIVLVAWRARRQRTVPRPRVPVLRLAGASVLALLSHGLVIAAMNLGALATVAALRETAVVFAAIIGSTVLGEPFGRNRIAASVCVAAGVIVLHAAG